MVGLRWTGWVALSLLVAGPVLADDFELEVGLRLERLAFDEGLEFTCSCDPEEDPGCDTDPDFCQDVRLDQAVDGYMFGALIGGQGRSRWAGAGLRLVASAGGFSPTDAKPGVVEDSLLLGQLVVELRIEAHAPLGPAEVFVQASPRVGGLFYFDDHAGSPGTFVGGIVFTAGLRLGSTEQRVGAEAGAVVHPSFRGWLVQATFNQDLGAAPGEPDEDSEPVLTDPVPAVPAQPEEEAGPPSESGPTTP